MTFKGVIDIFKEGTNALEEVLVGKCKLYWGEYWFKLEQPGSICVMKPIQSK